jgi:mRNA interferase MazF
LSPDPTPLRGEIWLVNFDPTIGAEIRKTRPAVVISSNSLSGLPLKLVAPLTEWKDHFSGSLWHIRVMPSRTNGLLKASAIDALQLRCVDIRRFMHRTGVLPASTMTDVCLAVAAVIEHP